MGLQNGTDYRYVDNCTNNRTEMIFQFGLESNSHFEVIQSNCKPSTTQPLSTPPQIYHKHLHVPIWLGKKWKSFHQTSAAESSRAIFRQSRECLQLRGQTNAISATSTYPSSRIPATSHVPDKRHFAKPVAIFEVGDPDLESTNLSPLSPSRPQMWSCAQRKEVSSRW